MSAGHLARQQAALHRVATLVARQRPAREVFLAVTEELGGLLEVEDARLVRYEPDGSATIVASWGELAHVVPDGTNRALAPDSVLGTVLRTGRSARLDDYETAGAEITRFMKAQGIRASVAGPIVVDGAIWGALVAATRRPVPLPPEAEARIAQFSELVTTSISIVETREQLTASRARIVAATDQARQRFERDLHDGVQQRLVAIGLQLRMLEARMGGELAEAAALLRPLHDELDEAADAVQELARGIHPAILSRGGLTRALRALVRRADVPTTMAIEELPRLGEQVEVAAHHVVSEALANATRHAAAATVEVVVRLRDERLEIVVADDGAGGADPAGGGLVALADRVEAVGGTLAIDSPAGVGTTVRAWLPAPAA